MKRIKILSDYTPTSQPNILTIFYDDQNDVHISLRQDNDNERGVRIAASGTRHSGRVRRAFWELIKAYEEELQDEHCHPDLQKVNGHLSKEPTNQPETREGEQHAER